MQREQISIPKNILYAVLILVFYALQTSLLRSLTFRGYHIDLLPCFVAAAALLDGPAEGVITGVMVGVLYDLGYPGLDGMYPLFFLLYGLVAGNLSRSVLSRNYISVLMLTFLEMMVLGVLRFFLYLMPHGASFGLVLQQTVGGALLTVAFAFLVYWPMGRISRRFDARGR